MAYVVGSASVEIVPDFRNAQLKITEFFRSQGDQLKVDVKPEIDKRSVQNVEKEAAQAGTRIGKALSEGASRGVSRDLTGSIRREITKLEADIDRARRQGDDATKSLRVSELRLEEARRAGNRSASQMLNLELAVEKAENRISEANRTVTQSTDRLREARSRLSIETRRVAEADAEAARVAVERQEEVVRKAEAKRVAADQRAADAAARRAQIESDKIARIRLRAAEKEARDEIRAVERAIAERAKLETRAEAVRARESEKFARQESDRLKKVYREAEQNRIRIQADDRQSVEEGRRTGGLFSRALEEEIHQNAEVITAVIGGILIGGAPALLGAASTLFFGLGAIAVAQTQEIRSSWKGLWDEIKQNSVADSAILVPTFERMAFRIGESFERLRPQVRDAFESLSPQIDTFSDSLVNTAENALPGLVHAVEAGGPVISGLGDLLERTGTGLSDLFDILSEHGPAAGNVFSELGDAMGELLPLLGELLGQGAETAQIVLPALTEALSTVHGALQLVDGILPQVLTGFLAFRSIQGVGRFVSNVGVRFGVASLQGGAFASTQRSIATGLSNVGKVAPGVGAVIGALAIVYAESEQNISDWATALEKGGVEADRARAQMAQFDDILHSLDTGIAGFIISATPADALLGFLADDTEEANAQFEAYLDSLTPIERAQRDLDIATRNLARAQEDQSTTSDDLADLQGEVTAATDRLRRAQEELQRATEGVTEAQADQADQARARVDANFAYEKATLKVSQAQQDYKDTLADTEATADDVREALLKLNEAYVDQIEAAGDLAASNLPASLDDTQVAILRAKGELDELNKLIESGVELPQSILDYRDQLIAITDQADGATLAQAELAGAVGELGFVVESIPGTKTIVIHAPTDELTQRLDDLGFSIETLPNGDIRVTANTFEAQQNLGDLSKQLDDVDRARPDPDVSLNDAPFEVVYEKDRRLLYEFDGQRPTPEADLDDSDLQGATQHDFDLLGDLDDQRPNPEASLVDRASSGILGILGLIRSIPASTSTTITTNVVTRYTQVGTGPNLATIGATGGAVEGGMIHGFDGGGAVRGPGGPLDDLIHALGPDPFAQYRLSDGEHILDAHDVDLMGGQAGVYAFREMLNGGRLGRAPAENGVRQMVASDSVAAPAPASSRDVTIYTWDNPRALVRAMKAEEQQSAALAPVW